MGERVREQLAGSRPPGMFFFLLLALVSCHMWQRGFPGPCLVLPS